MLKFAYLFEFTAPLQGGDIDVFIGGENLEMVW
jgi:hypothetical protein